ncbi:MAG: hypothetical protein VX684_02215 [Planctomycetota bacterium]|nr:hypothetical protein [Planctomycetota bacterium]
MQMKTTLAVMGLSGLLTASFASAQESAAPPADPASATATTPGAERFFVVDRDGNINVRTAASVEGGYPFFQLSRGAVVEVIDERYGWARVRTATPAFESAYGYVRTDAIEADGMTGTVLRRTSLRAPNLNKDGRPSASFEALDPALDSGTELVLIERIPGTRANDPGNWKVQLPHDQLAWINAKMLRKASAEEIAAIMPVMAKQDAEAKPTEADASQEPTPASGGEVITLGTTPAPTPTGDDGAAAETTGENEETEETVTAVAVEQEALSPAAMRAERLAELDDAFREVLREDIESAELQTLQREFAKLAEDPDITDVQKATVQSRIDVLEIKGDVQDRLARLKAMRERTRIDGDNINATRMAMDTRAPFDIVGQLNASVVFSGSNTMPQLFRLQDMAGGHTIAYVVPDKRYDMASWTGLSVGIIGSVEYDEALQLNVVRPRRIDLLAKQTAGTDQVTGGATRESDTDDASKEPAPATDEAVVEATTDDGTD